MIPERFQRRSISTYNTFQFKFQTLIIFSLLNRSQWMVMRVSDPFTGSNQPLQAVNLMIQITLCKRAYISMIKTNALLQLRNHFINIHQLTQRFSKRSLYMQCLCIGIQIPTHFPNILDFLIVFRCNTPDTNLQTSFQLIQHGFLSRFIGMKLQTKILNTKCCQSLLHNLKCSHFLRHKKNRLPLCKRICNHCCNSL